MDVSISYITLRGGFSRHTGPGELSVTGFLMTNLLSVSVHCTEDCRAPIWCAHAYLLARKVFGRLCSNGDLLFGAELENVSMCVARRAGICTHTLKSAFLKTGSFSLPVAASEWSAFTASSSKSISISISKWCEGSLCIGRLFGYSAVNNRHEREGRMHKHTSRSFASPTAEDWAEARSVSSNSVETAFTAISQFLS